MGATVGMKERPEVVRRRKKKPLVSSGSEHPVEALAVSVYVYMFVYTLLLGAK